jgi:hypothetical protein
MTTDFDPPQRQSTAVRSAVLALLLAGVMGCETETEPLYGEPDEVVGATSGAGQGPTTSTQTATSTSTTGAGGDGGGTNGAGGAGGGTVCDPNAPCAVSFETQVLPALQASCGNNFCHGEGATASAIFAITDKAATYTALTTYEIAPNTPYVVPCDANKSGMLCNIIPTGGDPSNACGEYMPPFMVDDGIDAMEFDLFSQWIECGAPNN